MSELAPVIVDQYLAARAYYGSVVGLLFLEGVFRVSRYSHLRISKSIDTLRPHPQPPYQYAQY